MTRLLVAGHRVVPVVVIAFADPLPQLLDLPLHPGKTQGSFQESGLEPTHREFIVSLGVRVRVRFKVLVSVRVSVRVRVRVGFIV